jgi:hypothetical protein
MLALEINYSSRKTKVTGPDRVAFQTNKELLEFVQQNLVAVARDFLKEEQDKNEFPKKEFLTLVDNKLNAKDITVKPLGKIEYVTKIESISEIVVGVMRLVVERSPTVSGYYQSTNVLFYNGKVVAKGIVETNNWFKVDREFKSTDKFRIVNLSPYARKLERLGVKRGTRGKAVGQNNSTSRTTKNKKGKKVLAPNGAYWLAKNAARRKYKQLKNNINFSFIPILPSVAKSQNTKSFNSSDFTFRTGKGRGRDYLYPSISITIEPSSFTQSSGFTEDGAKL